MPTSCFLIGELFEIEFSFMHRYDERKYLLNFKSLKSKPIRKQDLEFWFDSYEMCQKVTAILEVSLKFIYSEKATNFSEISNVDLS